MKRSITLIIITVLCAVSLFAQTPEKFSYQAVVRNASNALVTDSPVGIRISLMQGGVNGNIVFRETHTAITNANGLVTIAIGSGNLLEGSIVGIDWANGPYFLKTEIDPNGGSNYTISSEQQLLSVPYALYSKEAGNGFSGDYNDLTNRPQIPQTVGELTNDANYITMDSVPAIPTNVSAFYNDVPYLTAEQQILSISHDTIFLTGGSFVKLPEGFDGDYNSLTNKPTIPTTVGELTNDAGYITMDSVPTNVSAFTYDAGYLTGYTETDPQFNVWDKDYNDLINTPTIPTVPTDVSVFNNNAGYITMDSVPTNVSAFTNDAGYITMDSVPTIPTNVSAFTNDAGYLTSFTEQQILSISNDTIFLTGGSFVKLPAGFDGDYNSLSNKPELFSGDYNDLINQPTIPTIPTDVSVFNNDAGYITMDSVPTNVSAFTNDVGYITMDSVPTIPTNVSAFTNDAGYLTDYTETDPQFNAWNKDYNDLINTPTIPTIPNNVSTFINDVGYITMDSVPTNISSFTNDVGYLTVYTEIDPQFNAWDKDYNDLTNKPNLFSGNYSDLTNKPNLANVATTGNYNDLINKPTIPTVPTNVSAFVNDAGYLTAIPDSIGGISIESDPVFSAWDKDYNDLTNRPELFSGDYNDLTNTPSIPTVPTDVSAFNNDAGYITQAQVPTQVNADWNATSGAAQILHKPTIPTIPSNVSVFNNDANYITNIGNNCENTLDLCNLMNTIESLQNQVQELSNMIGGYPYGTVSSDTCPQRMVMIDGNPNVCYEGINVNNVVLVAWVDGAYDTYATYKWYESGEYRPNMSGFANYYFDCWQPTYDNPYIFTVKVTQSDGCSYTSAPFKVNVYDKPYATITGTADEVCTGGEVTLRANLQNYNDPMITFQWYEAEDALPGRTHEIEHFAPTTTTDFIVKVTHLMDYGYNACVAYDTFRVEVTCDTTGGGINPQSTFPTVTTDSVTVLSSTSATCGGNVTSEGGSAVTARGVCWSSSHNPTLADDHTTDGSGTGSFSSNITGLTNGTTYYVKAYATNQYGTVYGNEVSFSTVVNPNGDSLSCPNTPLATDIDGNIYNTVMIGGQCWLRENLRTTKYADGENITPENASSFNAGSWYYPGYDSSYKSTYGLLYNWPAVMRGQSSSDATPSGVQGICPNGWHVPSKSEWIQLLYYIGTQYEYVCGSDTNNIAKALASTSDWEDSPNNCAVGNTIDNNNKTGFDAKPAGFNGYHPGSHAIFWTATESSNETAWGCSLGNNSATVSFNGLYGKQNRFSIRCVRDDETAQQSLSVMTSNVSNISTNSAVCGGSVASDGVVEVIEKGVCWSLTHNPTKTDNYTNVGGDISSFTANITELASNLTYFVRAYVTNQYGTVYGNEVSFTTSINSNGDEKSCVGTPVVTDVDGNTYNTVLVGNQCWMRENLRVTHYADGTAFYDGDYPSNDSSYKQSYGLLYNWNTVMGNATASNSNPSGVQGVCPNGWHVPSNAEWTQLVDNVGSQSENCCNGMNIAKALAFSMGWFLSSNTCSVGNNQATNNRTSLGILPAGGDGSSYGFGASSYFWTSTDTSSGHPNYIELSYHSTNCYSTTDRTAYNSLSVRCLRDGNTTTAVPSVTTNNVSNITENSATCGGNITSEGGSAVTARGVCWSTSTNPTPAGSHTTDSNGTGSFTSNLTGLSSGTTYYVRAYATNGTGTGYGELKTFTTSTPSVTSDGSPCPGAPTVKDFDNNVYNTVQIGDQCWMKENMRSKHYSDGSSIYGYANPGNSQSYGYLYTWSSAVRASNGSPSYRGICPTGWHVPSNGEWTDLIQYVSNQSQYLCSNNTSYIAKALASTNGWNSATGTCVPGLNPNTNNATGFSALPTGIRSTSGSQLGNEYSYSGSGDYTIFWSSTPGTSGYAWVCSITNSSGTITRNQHTLAQSSHYNNAGYTNILVYYNHYFSVRCLRD